MSRLVQIGGRRRPSAPPAPPDGPGVYVDTFGCQMNETDSALIVGQLTAAGYRSVADPAQAAVVLINTCAIRERAEERVYGRASQLLQHRQNNPDLVIGITGCMAEHLRSRIAARAPYVSLLAGPDSYRDIAVLVDRARRGETVVALELDRTETYEGLDGHVEDDGVSGFVAVQRGCDRFCSFCVVPFTRGRERGVPPREILRQVARLAERGYREVTLLGQTVNSYRWEDLDFADLLGAVAEVPGIARVRFTSPHPAEFTARLVDAIARGGPICPQVHLPLQSGSDRMLAIMKRGYDRAQYLDLVDRLRERVPELALSTDLMVGFCGETEAEHAETLAVMDRVRFDSAFMFSYSDRGITHAARHLVDDVPPEVKARRLREVIDLQELHTRAAHEVRIGREEEILVAGPSRRRDHLVGKTRRFQRALLPAGSAAAGELVRRRVRASTGRSLIVD